MMGPLTTVFLFTTRMVCATDAAPDNLECRKMSEIYSGPNPGKELCEEMWGGSFKYEPDETKGYTMWFLTDNPNPATSAELFTDDHADLDVCHVQYNHKPTPGAESLNECIPWSDHGCCSPETVADAQTLKEAQGGPEYHWDRCGSLSAGCEKFFIEEACFYECEPAVGLFRKYPREHFSEHLHNRDGHEVHDDRCNTDSDTYNKTFADANCDMGWYGHNHWQIHQMPIKASYCDAFFDACKNDLFCGHGDFFACARVNPDADDAAKTTAENRKKYLEEEKRLREGAITVPEEESSAFVLGLAALGLFS
jgi:folate receptor